MTAADTFLPNPQPPDIYHVTVITEYPMWQIFLFGAFAAASVVVLKELWELALDKWYERHDGEPSGHAIEDAAEDPERAVGGWTPDLPRNHYVGDDGEPHPIDEQAEKVNS